MKSDAYLTITNSGGIEIKLNRSQDGLYYWFNNEGVCDEPKEAEIEFDQDGDAYFRTENGTIYQLIEFLKVNF